MRFPPPDSVWLDVPDRALAVGAHPDDIEFGAGATLARWAEAGCQVSFVVCTDGSKGTWDPHADTAALVATRQGEARTAARTLGATGDVIFLGRTDGELENDRAVRSELARAIRQIRPDVLLGHDPWKRYRLHPDHRAAGFLTCDALVAARDPHFFPEHDMVPHRPSALLLFEADEPNHAEPAEERHLMSRIAALESHRSQYESTMFITDREPPAPDTGTGTDTGTGGTDGTGAGHEPPPSVAAFRAEQRLALEMQGRWADTALAEAFRLLPTDR
ncbi:MAG: PIG-L family deacetylase [Microthrixaceae bacterium]|nr:PIG-L family deacetylase [Acidimicrobiales bacterium]MCB9404730.1 PIG-L family deacetylase [Microthrixaceae bacterium]